MVGAPGAAGPLGNMAEAPPRVGRRAHRRGSAKGMWRAQRSVKPPRKLWGFDSLPAHHSVRYPNTPGRHPEDGLDRAPAGNSYLRHQGLHQGLDLGPIALVENRPDLNEEVI